jgi:hypothetical protein
MPTKPAPADTFVEAYSTTARNGAEKDFMKRAEQ